MIVQCWIAGIVLVRLILPWGFGVMGLSVPSLVAASCKSHLPPAGIPELWQPWGAVPPPGGPSLSCVTRQEVNRQCWFGLLWLLPGPNRSSLIKWDLKGS